MSTLEIVEALDGTITIKPLTESDREKTRTFVKELSVESIRQRLGGASFNFSESHLAQILRNSLGPDCVLGAFNTADRLIGIARYARAAEFCAEFAVIVSDDCKKRGIATQLMVEIENLARSFGYREMTAQTLSSNVPMRKLAKSMGYCAVVDPLDGTTLLLSKRLNKFARKS